MKKSSTVEQALRAAVLRLLRPLVRLLLRHSVPFSVFEELAKRVYVDTAMQDFALPGKKPTISRASVLTGLTRKDVQRLLQAPEQSLRDVSQGYNRAARVLTAWGRDADFVDSRGHAKALEFHAGFSELVRRHSGDMPARAVLEELLRVGAVRERDDGTLVPATRAYVPMAGEAEKLGILGADVASLIDTIDHNLPHGADDPRFQRKVLYQSIDVDALPAFRKLSAEHAQSLLEELDRWLAQRDEAPSGARETPQARVGMGVYYIEERLGDLRDHKGTTS
ncbi:MAG: DUF6502 family protein [Caldimonas sp.]